MDLTIAIFININKNPIFTFVGFIELISEISRVISLSFRLFGNVFAGEVLLIVISYLMPFVLPLPFMFIEPGSNLLTITGGSTGAALTTVFSPPWL